MPDDQPHEPSEITYAEHFHPARPPALRHRARVKAPVPRRRSTASDGAPVGTNPAYVSWLLSQSMLADANEIGRQFSGQGTMWQNPYANPGPRQAVEAASVWFTAYPLSFITRPGESFLAALADEALWEALTAIGIQAVHTGPVKRAGGITGWRTTPSVDGHFDRISTDIDPAFGTEAEFRAMCGMATWSGGTVIDDIVPGHTGKGADFRLAEMCYGDYPGIYHMIEIEPEDWVHLPEVRPGRDSVNIDPATEEQLEKAGYIIGRLQRVIFYTEGVKETNWSATAPVVGADGVERRWVYLHYFKDGQPSINWLDPSFAGMRLVIGDALHSLADLGAGGLRLDANGFLGVEKTTEDAPAWSEGHPLSEAANHLIAGMIRKMGGFSFQELNLAMDDIKAMGETGADLSYDFVTRPAYHHALVTADTEFLRLALNLSRGLRIDPASLVHALQNHDELTHELVHFSTRHRDDPFTYRGETLTGCDLGERVRADLNEGLTGQGKAYNRRFTQNGIACTTATVICATLGIEDVGRITRTEREQIKQVHLLLAMFNALQPGVFALSGWDLSGMLTVDAAEVADLIGDGDTRWINRGAHDLRAAAEPAREGRMPPAPSLYGTLPDQLAEPDSFASRLRRIIEVRGGCGLATAVQLDIPDVSHRAELVLVHRLADASLQLTVLNFSGEAISGSIRSEHLPAGATVTDMFSEEDIATVDDLESFP